MKKTLFAIAAMVAMVACNNDYVVKEAAPEAIEFDGIFVDNSTRVAYDGSYTVSTLESFQVYGTVTGTGTDEGTGNIFNGETVTKSGDDWTYDSTHTQYWVPGNNYKFRAIVDGNVEGVTKVVALEADKYMASAINLFDASAQKDILTAESVYTNYTKPTEGTQPVAFTFKHILAKAKFTFKNTVTTNNGYSYKVTNVRIVDAVKNGVYTITDGTTGTWTAAATPETYDVLSFGNVVETGTANGAEAKELKYNTSAESNYDRLLIPGVNTPVTVKFDYQLLKDGAVIDTHKDVTTSATVTLEAGHAYNFVVCLANPGDPITFKLETITNWDTDLDHDDEDEDETPIQ